MRWAVREEKMMDGTTRRWISLSPPDTPEEERLWIRAYRWEERPRKASAKT